ncbi:hypothetical protein G7075_00045 [Phycicoccus sp. HDW14]|uniref:hypothetical protein n=1 Tax=Phycicoccus sp. HDW14 TaxID=2714941 RepID=UPI00140B1147|nr:hypothetical protein [Phycicoccus sp. HDW14]QIM19887.1 hypothetical protein G7075_00045 [Phycicoccus sp. HDW14]
MASSDYRPRTLSKTALRDLRVLELVAQGKGFDEVAALCGYANRSGAHKAYHRALKARSADLSDEQMRVLELHRLDILTDAVWEAAISGDLAAVREAHRLHVARVRLLGLSVAPGRSNGRGEPEEDGDDEGVVTGPDRMEQLREERARRAAERTSRA